MNDDNAVTDEIDCLKAENRLLRAALEAQRRWKHDLAACACRGCGDIREILGVNRDPPEPPPLSMSMFATQKDYDAACAAQPSGAFGTAEVKDAGPTPFGGRRTDRGRT